MNPAAICPDARPRVPRILAVDDSELMHRLLRTRLQLEQVEIHCALTGEEGLRLAAELQPEVMLLDIDLDGMDGFEVLQRLKENPRTRDIAVIFISASCETMDRVRCLDLGAVDFIPKPFEMAELKARVRSAIRVQQLLRMLSQRAQLDGLTALWNRAYFDQRLAAECAESKRHGKSVALVMCDIDHFKSVNDRFGHPFGDEVLALFASILSGGRASDVPCRYGGEEFGVILPATTLAEAVEVAERFRRTFEEHQWRRHPDLVLTASFGVAELALLPAGATPADLLMQADSALYASKRSGRNRVSTAGLPKAAA
ncbi:MAG: Response regulator PleD [Planctomycetota bacterium]|jgi:diguanylate cyclase (GGDEF)-like protein